LSLFINGGKQRVNKYMFAITYHPNPSEGPPKRLAPLLISANTDTEAIFAANAIADFAMAAVAEHVMIQITAAKSSRHVETICRPTQQGRP
jgi:hypothetical protein